MKTFSSCSASLDLDAPGKTKSYNPQVVVDPSEERRIVDFRPLGFHDVVVLGRYQYARARAALEPHNHGNMIEICYLERGQQTYRVGSQTYSLQGGDLFVTLPHEWHGSGRAPQGKGVLYWLLINVPGRNERLLTLTVEETQIAIDRFRHLPARRFSGGKQLGRTLHQTLDLAEHGVDPLDRARLRNLLLDFLFAVLDASRHAQRCASPTMTAVQRAIAENLDRPLPIRDLARRAHLSPSRFKTRFKAEVGVSPAEYVLRQRIARAKRWLRQRDRSVTEIAMLLGFSTTQYFATVFKRYTAQTPTEYRTADYRFSPSEERSD
ncbi:MAG: AraC family transcriptional regulator [Thermoguttaceae bacterium]